METQGEVLGGEVEFGVDLEGLDQGVDERGDTLVIDSRDDRG